MRVGVSTAAPSFFFLSNGAVAGLVCVFALGPGAFVGGAQPGTLAPRALETKQPAKTADLGVGAGPRRRLHQRLDQLHHAVPGVDIDAGLRIGEALFAHASAYVGIQLCAMA